MQELLMLLCLLYIFKRMTNSITTFLPCKKITFAITAPTTYRNVSHCKLCSVDEFLDYILILYGPARQAFMKNEKM